LWQQQLDELPFVVGEICRIRYAFHPLVYMPFPFFTPVSDSFLRVINLTNAMGGVRPELVGLEEVQRLTRLRFPRIPEELLRILVGNNTLRVAGTIVLFYTLRAQSLVGDRVLEACFWGWPLGGYKSPAGCWRGENNLLWLVPWENKHLRPSEYFRIKLPATLNTPQAGAERRLAGGMGQAMMSNDGQSI
jgi:hypothetical protein